jgi:hypothetical protein
MNLQVFICAVLFWLAQNSYFGWNWLPKSDAEMIADGITYLLLAMSFMTITTTINVR